MRSVAQRIGLLRGRRWPLLALGLVAWAVAENLQGEWRAIPPGAAVLLVLFGVAPLAAMAVRPVAVVVVVATSGELVLAAWGAPKSLVMFFVTWIAAYGAAAYAPSAWAVRAPLFSLQFSTVFVAEFRSSDGWSWSDFGFSIVLFGFAIGTGTMVNRRSREAATAQQRRLAAEAATQTAVAAERARIARDLHDVVAHSVSLMVVQAAAARSVLERRPEAAVTALDAIESSGQQALGELRRLLDMVRGAGDPMVRPGIAAIDDLAQQARDGGAVVSVTTTGSVAAVPPGPDAAAYRIVQEALTNARKHAPGAPVRIHIDVHGDRITIDVVNDLVPNSAHAAGAGYGIFGMHERVALYGGTLRAGPSHGRWELQATLHANAGHPPVDDVDGAALLASP